jgi:hypothetical protein
LWEDLKAEQESREEQNIIMRQGNITSDCIENLHSRIRNFISTPHAGEYPAAFSSALIDMLTTSTGKKKNCKEDNALNLLNLHALLKQRVEETIQPKWKNNEIFADIPDRREEDEHANQEAEQREDEPDDVTADENEESNNQVTVITILTIEQYRAALAARLKTVAASGTIGPILEAYFKNVDCKGCHELLLTEAHFPLQRPPPAPGPSAGARKKEEKQLVPSQALTTLVNTMYEEAQMTFMNDFSVPDILNTFASHMHNHPHYHQFQLCANHAANKKPFSNQLCHHVLMNAILALRQEFKERKRQERKQKQSKKAKRVLHE